MKYTANLQELWDAGMEETIPAGNGTAMAQEQQTEVEAGELSDGNTQYSIREEDPPKKTGIAYKVFFEKNGKLYPPMVANPGGADTPVGVWLNADVGAAAPPSKTGRLQVKAGGKGTQGGSGSLAFRPGWHLGDIPKASQFNRLNKATGVKELFPYNFVWAECEYAMDVDYQEEAMSYGYNASGKFQHSLAGLPRLPVDGYYHYRTNPDPSTVPWVITGAMKVNKILSRAEVDEILRENGVEPTKWQGPDGEQMEADDGVKRFSIRDLPDGRKYVDVDTAQAIFEGKSGYEVRKAAHDYIKEHFRGKVIGKINRAYMRSDSERKYLYPNKINDKEMLNAIWRAAPELGNLLDASTYIGYEEDSEGHDHGSETLGFNKYRVLFHVGDAWVEGILNVKVTNRGDIFYGISKTKNTAVSPTAHPLNEQSGRTESDVSDNSIAGFGDNVNRKNQERYSTRDQTDTVSVREYLAGMTPKSYMNGTEVELLKRYQTKLKELQEKQRAGLMRLFRHFVHASPAVLPHAPPPHWLIGFNHYTIVQGK